MASAHHESPPSERLFLSAGSDAARAALLAEISLVVVALVASVASSNPPSMHVSSRAASNVELVFSDGYTLKQGAKKTSKQFRSITSILCVLTFVSRLLKERKTATQRELYYSFPLHFKTQTMCNEAILDCAALLGVERETLNLRASARGLFAGNITVLEPSLGFEVDGREVEDAGQPISAQWITSSAVQCSLTDARCVFVIEKEGIFRRLVEDRFTERFPSVLICGRGFPDLATRAMVHQITERFQIPAYGVADCNPFGLALLLTYKVGSARMGDKYAVTSLKWLGFRPSQIAAQRLPAQVMQPLSARDKRRLTSIKTMLETSGFAETHEAYVEELELMEEQGTKCELEALAAHSFTYLATEFLERAVTRHEFI